MLRDPTSAPDGDPGPPTGSDRGDDVLEVEPGAAGKPRVRAGVADVDDRDRVLVRAGEELRVEAGGVEAGHRARGEAGRADAEDEVRQLQGPVELGRVCADGVV